MTMVRSCHIREDHTTLLAGSVRAYHIHAVGTLSDFERLFLAVPQGCLRFVIVGFLDHTHLLFF